MLSSRVKDELIKKLNFNIKRKEKKESDEDTSTDEETTTDEETNDTDDTDTEQDKETYTDEDTNAYKHLVNLKKNIPKKTYGKIHVCVYKVNSQEMLPFIMFLLYKYGEELSFPILDYYNGDIPTHVLDTFKSIFESDKEVVYKGFIEYNGDIVVIIECISGASISGASISGASNKNQIERGIYNSKWQWALTSEIINVKDIMKRSISSFATKFLLDNSEVCLLYRNDGTIYETPEVGYYGSYYKKIAATAVLGMSREDVFASFGPYYYFSNFQYAMRYAVWSVNYKPQKIGTETITVDDKGRYIKGGLVRFALFTGRTKMLLGREFDKPDESIISKELAEKSEFIRGMIKLRDNTGSWAKKYNSIRIGSHYIEYKYNVTTQPIVSLKDYEQQVPLEFYFVDTSNVKETTEVDNAVIL